MIRGSGSADLVGDAAVAATAATPLYLSDLTYRLRDVTADPYFLVLGLISARGRAELGSRVRQGSGPAKARGDDILGVPVPAAPRERQEQAAATARQRQASIAIGLDLLAQSVDLLTEYKQSLITAAVTGDLDVTTAGSGVPG